MAYPWRHEDGRWNMTIIERLNQFFLNCPLLQEGKIKFNYLPADEREYSIDGIPATQIIKQYLDGSSIRQYQFVFRTQAYHSLESVSYTHLDVYKRQLLPMIRLNVRRCPQI